MLDNGAKSSPVRTVPKLRVDFLAVSPLPCATEGVPMVGDITTGDIIQSLCVTAGTIMEDASVDAVSTQPKEASTRSDRVRALAVAGHEIYFLLAAAEIMARRDDGLDRPC